MKPAKITWVLIFVGVFLLLSGMVIGKSFVGNSKNINYIKSGGNVMVHVKNQNHLSENDYFAEKDIGNLKGILRTDKISYTVESNPLNSEVTYKNKSYKSKVVGVNYLFNGFYNVHLKSGSFFSGDSEETGSKVAVIENEAAWRMFNTDRVVGKSIDIYGSSFKIIGVMDEDTTIIKKLMYDDVPKVYIPAATLLDIDKEAKIDLLLLEIGNTGLLEKNKNVVFEAIQAIGKNPSNYTITDLAMKSALMAQRPLLIAFFVGIICIVVMLVYAGKQLISLILMIQESCKKDYFIHVVRKGCLRIFGKIGRIAVAITAAVLIWSFVSFKIYIPPQLIPDELINISYFVEIIKEYIMNTNLDNGYKASFLEMEINAVNMIISISFYAAVVLGFLLLYIGFFQVRLYNADTTAVILGCGLSVLISLGLIAAMDKMMGYAPLFELNNIIVMWVFLSINSLLFTKIRAG